MLKDILTKVFLAALCALCALAFEASPPTAAAQSAGKGKLVGRIVERGTNQPLPAEVGVSLHAAGSLLMKHAQATDQGEFVIDGLEAGRIHLVTKLDGYAAEHQNISLGEGETRRVEFALTKVKLLRGNVRGPAGKPLYGATVRVIYATDPPARGEIRTTYQWETGETHSDRQGNFIIGVHPERAFVVEATHPDLLGEVSTPKRIGAAEKEASVTMTLDSGVNVAGEVRDESGRTVQGAQVRLIEVGSRRAIPNFTSHELLRQQTRFTASEANGAFSFEQVRPTRKMLVIVHPGYMPYKQLVELARAQKQPPLRVVLTARR